MGNQYSLHIMIAQVVADAIMFRIDDTVRRGNTSICEKFDCKPNGVLKGGECNEYVKE
jgi:hypothetical protein